MQACGLDPSSLPNFEYNKYPKYVCSKHFVDQCGPTSENLNPVDVNLKVTTPRKNQTTIGIESQFNATLQPKIEVNADDQPNGSAAVTCIAVTQEENMPSKRRSTVMGNLQPGSTGENLNPVNVNLKVIATRENQTTIGTESQFIATLQPKTEVNADDEPNRTATVKRIAVTQEENVPSKRHSTVMRNLQRGSTNENPNPVNGNLKVIATRESQTTIGIESQFNASLQPKTEVNADDQLNQTATVKRIAVTREENVPSKRHTAVMGNLHCTDWEAFTYNIDDFGLMKKSLLELPKSTQTSDYILAERLTFRKMTDCNSSLLILTKDASCQTKTIQVEVNGTSNFSFENMTTAIGCPYGWTTFYGPEYAKFSIAKEEELLLSYIVNPNLSTKLKIFGKDVESHPVLEVINTNVSDLNDVLKSLNILKDYAICFGNNRSEFEILGDKIGNGNFNISTNGLHSNSCLLLIKKDGRVKRCKSCRIYRKVLKVYTERVRKHQSTPTSSRNIRYLSKPVLICSIKNGKRREKYATKKIKELCQKY